MKNKNNLIEKIITLSSLSIGLLMLINIKANAYEISDTFDANIAANYEHWIKFIDGHLIDFYMYEDKDDLSGYATGYTFTNNSINSSFSVSSDQLDNGFDFVDLNGNVFLTTKLCNH